MLILSDLIILLKGLSLLMRTSPPPYSHLDILEHIYQRSSLRMDSSYHKLFKSMNALCEHFMWTCKRALHTQPAMLQHCLKKMALPKREMEIDSGYAYVILISTFMLRVFESYNPVTFGIYLIEFMEYFHTDDTFSVAFIGGLYPLFQALASKYNIYISYFS